MLAFAPHQAACLQIWVTLRCGESQVNMAYIGWATHVPQGLNQRAAMAKASATPNDSLSSDCALQPARMKLKPLVIVHHDVTVKITQALHTPPITPEERA